MFNEYLDLNILYHKCYFMTCFIIWKMQRLNNNKSINMYAVFFKNNLKCKIWLRNTGYIEIECLLRFNLFFHEPLQVINCKNKIAGHLLHSAGTRMLCFENFVPFRPLKWIFTALGKVWFITNTRLGAFRRQLSHISIFIETAINVFKIRYWRSE